MKIAVRDYRRIAAADIECSLICLVAGVNEAGKSSLSEAIAAALTGTAIADRFGIKKGDADQLVRRGAKTGVVRLTGEGGECRMTWPSCEYTTVGAAPPHASVYAAGLASVATMTPKERAEALASYLKAEPTKDDFAQAMEDRFSTESIDAIWAEIEAKGWDQTAATYEVARRDAGRDWGKLAGETFGSDKARNWRPAGWDMLFDASTAEDMTALVTDAAAALETAIAGQAVDEAELAGLRGIAAELDARKETAATAKAAKDKAAAELADARTARAALVEPISGSGVPCPHCGGLTTLTRAGPAFTLDKFTAPPEEENKRRREAIAASDGLVSRLGGEDAAAGRSLAMAESNLAIAEGAVAKIAGMGEKKGHAGLVTRAREALADRQRELAMRRQVDEAAGHYRTWLRSDLILKEVVPAGLRARKLGQAVGLFNTSILAPLCEVAGWAPVNLTETLDVRLGEWPYSMVSDGAKYRVRATLAVAMAKMDGSSMCIFDGADILDSAGRGGLVFMLSESGLPALIAMTTVRGAAVPDLAAAGLGATYLLESATAKPLATQKAA